MRITFLLPPDSLTGGMRVVAAYAQRLGRRGHKVTVIHPRHPRHSLMQILRSLRQTRSFPRFSAQPGRGPSYFDGMERDITRIRLPRTGPITATDVPDTDVHIATWWETAEWASRLPPSKGAGAYFLQHHETHIPGQPVDRVNATWRLPLKKIVVASWLADLARDQFGDPHATVIPNAVDTRQFHSAPRGKQAVPTIGFMYALPHFKGTDIALEAIHLARQQLPNLRIISFGLEHPVPSMPLPKNATFIRCPPQHLLRDLYAECDAWLFSSRVEGFGLPILEAMACRTPVIAAPAGAAPDLLAQGGGMLVPMEDPEAMSQAITQICLLADHRWRQLSATAHASATSHTWDQATDQFEAALEHALSPSLSC